MKPIDSYFCKEVLVKLKKPLWGVSTDEMFKWKGSDAFYEDISKIKYQSS